MHAAENELLPLRVVVQVLFSEQTRAAMAGGQLTRLPNNIKALLAAKGTAPSSLTTTTTHTPRPHDEWPKSPNLHVSSSRMKQVADDESTDGSLKVQQPCLTPSQTKNMSGKLRLMK